MTDISRRTLVGLSAAALGALVAPRLGQGQAEPQVPQLKFQVKSGTKGFRFLLKAANGKTLVSSEHYKNKADCLHAIDLIKRGAASATIEDLAP